jgi:acyl-CoA dehydrogenase
MNFEFSQDQLLLREQAQRFLGDRNVLRRARQTAESGSAFDADLWQEIAGLGWTAVSIPEEFGGLGLGYLELCVLAEEFGRTLAPLPFSSSIYLASEALLLSGTAEVKASWLPRIAQGAAIGTLAIAETRGAPTPPSIQTSFYRGGLNGSKIAVPDGMAAEFAVVLAKDTDPGLSWVLVDLNAKGVSREPCNVIDPSRPHANITFTGAVGERLGNDGDGWSLTEKLLDRAAVPFAFEQVGGASQCLQDATEWAKNRFAFGRPIGSFQAIKHKLADIFVAVELARSHAYFGAWALSADSPELPVAAAGARIAATEAYWLASRENIQVHGGIGFTYEADPHLYYRRSKQLALAVGSQRTWREKLIARLTTSNRAA